MKKIILSLLVFVLSFNCALASRQEDPKKEAVKKMIESHKYYHEVCLNAADNFRFDNQFSGYLKGKCILYESDRQRLLNSVFPVTNSGEEGYMEQYPILMSEFAIKMNNQEIENFKTIINEYCKHNKYKCVKRAPEACSEQTINALFEI